MAKIRAEIEIEVPNGAYCRGCNYCGIGVSSYCYLFNKELKTERLSKYWEDTKVHRCDECKKAEVQNGENKG